MGHQRGPAGAQGPCWIPCGRPGGGVLGRRGACVCAAECPCPPETVPTVLAGSTPLQNAKLFKKECSISWSTFTGLGGHISVLTAVEIKQDTPCSEGDYSLVAGTCRPAGSAQPSLEQWGKPGFGWQPCKECTASIWGAWKAHPSRWRPAWVLKGEFSRLQGAEREQLGQRPWEKGVHVGKRAFRSHCPGLRQPWDVSKSPLWVLFFF